MNATRAISAATAFVSVMPLAAEAQVLQQENARSTQTIAFQESQERWTGRDRAEEKLRDNGADPIQIGNYVIMPSVTTSVAYDDNVLAAAIKPRADIVTEIAPSIRMRSNFSRHSLDVEAGGRFSRHGSHEELDTNDAFLKADGALHFDHAHTLGVSVLSSLDHEDRLSFSAPARASELTKVHQNRLQVGIKRDAGRLHGAWSGTFETRDYHDVAARDGATIDQDGRDSRTLSTTVNLGYRFSPGLEFEWRTRALRQFRGSQTTSIAVSGYETAAGIMSEIGPLLRLRVMGGYALRDFDDARFATSGQFVAETEIQWRATPALNVFAGLQRAIEDSGHSAESAGAVDTGIKARIEYEAWKNLILTARAEYHDIVGLTDDRHDTIGTAGAKIEYLASDNWLLSLEYDHSQRNSTDAEFDLTRNRVRVGATLKF